MSVGELTHNSIITLGRKSLEKCDYQLNLLTHTIFVRRHATSPNWQARGEFEFATIQMSTSRPMCVPSGTLPGRRHPAALLPFAASPALKLESERVVISQRRTLLLRLLGGTYSGGQLQDSCVLPITERVEQHKVPVWELKRVVMDVRFVPVDSPKLSHSSRQVSCHKSNSERGRARTQPPLSRTRLLCREGDTLQRLVLRPLQTHA